ncbi:ComEA family DNA-binding protein [Candidatus Latescibacterota bacterium]
MDVNTATAAQLQSLPHVGPKTAASILDHRREHGPFATLDELCKVPGIGARTVEKLRSLAPRTSAHTGPAARESHSCSDPA